MILSIPVIAVGCGLVLVLVSILAYRYWRRRKSPNFVWKKLLSQLWAVDRSCIEEIARDAVDTSGQPRTDEERMQLKAEEIARLIGGLPGLEKLEQNSVVLVDMAFYVQNWQPGALRVTGEMREDARQIEWYVEQVRTAERNGKVLDDFFANYAQEATVIYYKMIRRLLTLYEMCNLPMLTDLQRVL